MKEEKKKEKDKIADKKKQNKKRKGPSVSTLILVAVLLTGLGIILYPSVSDWWNSMHATQAIAGYVSAVETMSSQEKEEILEAARAYNIRLTNKDYL